MSLEEELKLTREAVVELTKALKEFNTPQFIPFNQVEGSAKEVTMTTTTSSSEEAVEEPKKKGRGRPKKKEEVKPEPTKEPEPTTQQEEQTSMFPPEEQKQEAPKQVTGEVQLADEPRMGSAPVVNDADLPPWYEQARKRAAMYSRQTGDPTLTQKLAAEQGIGDLRKASNEQLYLFAVKLSELLKIDVMEALQ